MEPFFEKIKEIDPKANLDLFRKIPDAWDLEKEKETFLRLLEKCLYFDVTFSLKDWANVFKIDPNEENLFLAIDALDAYEKKIECEDEMLKSMEKAKSVLARASTQEISPTEAASQILELKDLSLRLQNEATKHLKEFERIVSQCV